MAAAAHVQLMFSPSGGPRMMRVLMPGVLVLAALTLWGAARDAAPAPAAAPAPVTAVSGANRVWPQPRVLQEDGARELGFNVTLTVVFAAAGSSTVLLQRAADCYLGTRTCCASSEAREIRQGNGLSNEHVRVSSPHTAMKTDDALNMTLGRKEVDDARRWAVLDTDI